MKPRKQRLHSAELRRLDRIAGSLDRIAAALERMPGVVMSGNDDTIENSIVGSSVVSSPIQIHGEGNIMQHQSGNGVQQNAGQDTNSTAIKGVKESFNTNSCEAIKNLTTALQHKTSYKQEG